MLILILLASLLLLGRPQYLSNVPITFSMQGLISYVPNTGGVSLSGYSLTLGFDRYQWMGIMFMTPTYTNNYDVLILQRSANQSGGVYACTVADYYLSPGRPTTLMTDSITNMDLTVAQSSSSSAYSLTFPRTIANTSGEDWGGGEFVKMCFFTSDLTFSTSTWSRQYESCFGYHIASYLSTFRGSHLGSMMFQGIQSDIYGGLYWTFSELRLFWYRNSSSLTNTSSLILKIGGQISDIVGNDYFICDSGDSFGSDIASLQDDLSYHGYNDGSCSLTTTASATFLQYSRNLNTYDDFDNTIGSSLSICVIGASNHCGVISLAYGDPVMTVSSALTLHQGWKFCQFFLLIILIWL